MQKCKACCTKKSKYFSFHFFADWVRFADDKNHLFVSKHFSSTIFHLFLQLWQQKHTWRGHRMMISKKLHLSWCCCCCRNVVVIAVVRGQIVNSCCRRKQRQKHVGMLSFFQQKLKFNEGEGSEMMWQSSFDITVRLTSKSSKTFVACVNIVNTT